MPLTSPSFIDYRCAQPADLKDVHDLEKLIEGNNAASFNTLGARLAMHTQGFLLAYKENTLVGYLQSCLWQRPNFESFDEISNFPALHTENGNEAYIIFLATHPHYRDQGIASGLLQAKTTLAAIQGLSTLSLVAKTELIPLYQKNGFDIARDMPNFLPHSAHTLMQKRL